MIIKQHIKDFENLGFGMFVHFGLYSVLEQGEWAKYHQNISHENYEPLAARFNPDPDWAVQLVAAAKSAGCKYITLTSRHHEGFSLYDTCGLNDYDAVHTCGRDLVREFVDECNKEGIIPFFYHTLLDWREPSYNDDFPKYLKYLRASVELLCKNYGKIGGIWFDGTWNKPDADWEEDALYGLIRSYQPDAMIINNTGISSRGTLGHIELDSVTFERGRPKPLNLTDSPKYIASEMCQIFGDTWGYCREDFDYKAPSAMIKDLCVCRKFGSNFLLNVGPMGNGQLRPIDKAYLDFIGQWTTIYDEAIHVPRPCGIEVEGVDNDFILCNGNTYYLFCHGIDALTNPEHCDMFTYSCTESFTLGKKIKSMEWMDNAAPIEWSEENGKTTVTLFPYDNGAKNHVVRVVKIIAE